MKKLTFLIVTFLIGGMMFTGCKKDDPTPTPTPVDPETNPTLTLKTGENYLVEGMEVKAYEDFRIGFVCAGKDLQTLQITFKKGEELIDVINKTCNPNGSEFEQLYTIVTTGDITMTAVLTDANDKTASLTVNFKVLENVPMLFAGSYEGFLIMDAVASAQGMGEMPMPTDSVMSKIEILINEGGETAVVTVTQPQGAPWVINATFDGETLVCEPYSESQTVGQVMTLTLTYTMKCTRVDNLLRIDGIVEGTGSAIQQGVEIPLSLTGTLIGDLEKLE